MKHSTRGLTMIEVLVVMGIFALAAGFAMFVSMESFRGTAFRSDRDVLVALLQRARSQAQHGICRGVCTNMQSHGVLIGASTYTLFQGTSYATRDSAQDAVFEASPGTTRTGLSEVVFSPLTGDSTTAGTITIAGQGKDSVITIGANGRISWTK